MTASMDFGFSFGSGSTGGNPRQPDQPLRVLVLGEFGGSIAGDLSSARLRRVDIDTLENVLASIGPRIDATDGSWSAHIKSFDNFHPDELVEKVALFQSLEETRRRLQDPATFAETAALLTGPTAPSTTNTVDSVPESPATPESDSDTLERILGQTSPADPQPSSEFDVNRLIAGIVSKYSVPAPDPRQQDLVRSVDEAMAGQMRSLLHSPTFQAVEARWRSLRRFVRLMDESCVELHILDVERESLARELAEAGEDITKSNAYRLIVEEAVTTAGGTPWSLIVATWNVAPTLETVPFLASLAALASQAGGPIVFGAEPAVVGASGVKDLCEPRNWEPLEGDAAAYWQQLRQSPLAQYIGLVGPRFLLRQPYGADSDPIDAFEFEELTAPEETDEFLWGPPSMACAELLAIARSQNQQAGDVLDQDDLPGVIYRIDGEAQLKPSAEVFLGERAANAMLEAGVMPLMSYKNRHANRLARFQSMASPPTPLAGLSAR